MDQQFTYTKMSGWHQIVGRKITFTPADPAGEYVDVPYVIFSTIEAGDVKTVPILLIGSDSSNTHNVCK